VAVGPRDDTSPRSVTPTGLSHSQRNDLRDLLG
jgi:hypothetical protein